MASGRLSQSSAYQRPQASDSFAEKRSQDISKEALPQLRRSARLADTAPRRSNSREKSPKQRPSSSAAKENYPPPLPSNGQKRAREVEDPTTERGRKRKRIQSPIAHPLTRHTSEHEAVSGITASQRSHISQWAEKNNWPKEFFKEGKMQRLLAKPRSSASLRRKRSEASLVTSTTPSDFQAEKSAPYKHPSYEAVLEAEAQSYMGRYKPGVTEASEKLCQTLLNSKQRIPEDTPFCDDLFEDTCDRLRGRNEARIFKDLTPLIVPGAEEHAARRANRGLVIAAESVNEGWINSIAITKSRPQPDYAIGLARSAFTVTQLQKLKPFLGDPASSCSYFTGTYYMLFPFFTCEVKGGAAGLDIADRQNAQSMTLAVRGVVELFRLVNRAEELHREILAFSVSHNHETVRIWGHFPVINGDEISYYRHSLRKYNFTEQRGQERWTAYTFTKNLYDIWIPFHLQRISSAVDALPPDLDLVCGGLETHISEAHTPASQQQAGSQSLSEMMVESQSSFTGLQQFTPDTSTQAEKPGPGPASREKKKKKGRV